MGIPRLTLRLEPYAKRVSFEVHDQTLKTAVIDGPALAFHILNLCLAQRDRPQSNLDSLPSLRELSQATLIWLETLEQHGFLIREIFFDGFLPLAKRGERKARLQQSVDLLIATKATHSDHGLGQISGLPDVLFSPYNQSLTPPHRKIAVPLNFVSAIQSALQASDRFGHVTRVVPGEADIFCALSACLQPTYVFTGDSDLLVHDIGQEGRVAFFKDIDFSLDDQASHLTFLEHHPHAVAKRLKLPGLLSLAYYANEHVRRSIPDLVELALKDDMSGRAQTKFSEPFSLVTKTPFVKSLEAAELHDTDAVCHGLSTHMMELIQQVDFKGVETTYTSIRVSLPVPNEDPTRASAHQPSRHVRMLMYSVLKALDERIMSVCEHNRRKNAVVSTTTCLYPLDSVTDDLLDLAEFLEGPLSIFESLPIAARWRAIAALSVLDMHFQAEKTRPSLELVSVLILNDKSLSLDWDVLHFRAELQCTLTAFSNMKQLFALIKRLEDHLELDRRLLVSIRRLHRFLDSLPGFADLFDWTDVTASMSPETLSRARSALRILADFCISNTEDDGDHSTKKKAKEKKSRPAKRKAEPATTRNNQNSFSALMDEWMGECD